jgi:hypothetical protein
VIWLRLAALLSLLAVARFLFLLFASAMRRCRWCDRTRKRCWRCGSWRQGFRRRGEHFRLGAPPVARVRDALRLARQEAWARRLARRIGDGP